MKLTLSWMMGAVLASVCICAAGCVLPGAVEPGLIAQYQESIVKRSPQPRAGQGGVDLLRPISDKDVVPLKIIKDPGAKPDRIELTLDQAVRLALLNSLDIRVVSFDPAISREAMVQAAAEFDFTVFGSILHTVDDASTGTTRSHLTEGELGLRKKTITGAEVSLAWELMRTRDASLALPWRRYQSALALEVTQPLLRDAWPELNLAALEVARIGEKVSFSQFRQKVEEIVTLAEATYWSLVQAREDVQIQQRLLDKTIDTLRRVELRRPLDATQVEVKQAEAAVYARRAGLLRTQKIALDAQDLLVRLLADERLGLLGQYIVVPTTPPVSGVTVDRADQLVNALRHSPVLEQARLVIEAADVNVRVAKNGALPRLDLVASVTLDGLDPGGEHAMEEMLSNRYVGWSLGATFEYPIGNRQRRSFLRQRRLERLQAITTLQNLADQVAVNVNEAIRQLETTYAEIEANSKAAAASRVQLQTLEDSEKVRSLTPEFLQVKLAAQESLAASERAELAAKIELNKALALLGQITGRTLKKHNIKLAAQAAADYRPAQKLPAGAAEDK